MEPLRKSSFVRLMTFEAMLRQECGWFDDEDNAVGILGAHLSGDAANVQNVRSVFSFELFISIRLRIIWRLIGCWISVKCYFAIIIDGCPWNHHCIFHID